MSFSLIAALMLQAVAPVSAPVVPLDVKKMSLKEVKAHNATLAVDHPNFIKCRAVAKTGSLVKRGQVCRTLAQWKAVEEHGNREARRLVEDGTSRPGGN